MEEKFTETNLNVIHLNELHNVKVCSQCKDYITKLEFCNKIKLIVPSNHIQCK